MEFDFYGVKENPCIILIHTMFTTGKMYEDLAMILKDKFFIIVPTLDGYNPSVKSEYHSTEEELIQMEAILEELNIDKIEIALGCSLGAALVWNLYQRGKVPINCVVIDSLPMLLSTTDASELENSFNEMVDKIQANPNQPSVFDESTPLGRMMKDSCKQITKNTIKYSCEICAIQKLPQKSEADNTKIIVVYGENDPNYENNVKALEALNDIKLIVVENHGHCDYIINKPDEFVKMILEV